MKGQVIEEERSAEKTNERMKEKKGGHLLYYLKKK